MIKKKPQLLVTMMHNLFFFLYGLVNVELNYFQHLKSFLLNKKFLTLNDIHC